MHQTLNNFFDATSAKNRYIHIVIATLILVVITGVSVSKKQIGHIDEFLSYSLANSGYMGRNHPENFNHGMLWYASDMMRRGYDSETAKVRDKIWDEPLLFIMFAGGGKTSLSNEEVKHIMMPSDEAKFNLAAVNWNQSFDVHPPLYYMLLNIICSIFYNNGEFSPWHGISLNLIIFFFTLPLVYYLMQVLSKGSHILSILAMCVYTFSGGGTVAFLRMYMLLTFFTLLYTCLILKFFASNSDEKKPKNDTLYALLLFLTIVFGSLSHHYFFLYMGISGLFLCIYLIFTRQIRNLIKFLKISIPSVTVSLLIFPFTLVHMFFNEHGAGDIMNRLSSVHILLEFSKYTGEYLDFVKHCIFGGAANFFLSFLFTGLLILYINRKKFKEIHIPREIWFLIATTLSFVIFVAITTKYHDQRYIMNVYPLFSVLFLYLFFIIYKAFFENIKFKPLFIVILLGLMANNNIKNIAPYMYPDSLKRHDIVEKYRNIPCVYVYDDKARSFMPRFGSFERINELHLYSRVDFVEYEHFNEVLSSLNEKSVIVYFCSFKGNQYDGDKERIENLLRNAVYPYKEITSERGFPVYELDLNR